MPYNKYALLQQTIQARGHTWKAGLTALSTLPPEKQARRLGLRLDEAEMARVVTMMMAVPLMRAGRYPAAWDWRNVDGRNWTTAVHDQDDCGACVAFSVVAVMETMLKRHHDNADFQTDLSEAHLFFCGCGNCCDDGWWPTYALGYAQENGVPDEACFPYRDQNMPCSSCADWQSRAVKAVAWQEIVDIAARKEWLAEHGPLVAGLAVYEDLFDYVGGVYRHTAGSLTGYHSVCVVGYSEAEKAWICKNSWGSQWGEAGWFKIGYGECGIDTQFAMFGIEAVDPAASPSPTPMPPAPSPTPAPTPPAPTPGPEPPGCNLLARTLTAWRSR